MKIWDQKYEFECNEPWQADRFLEVLRYMDIPIEDTYIAAKCMDWCQIQFRCSHETRVLLEYVYRRYIRLWPKYLHGVDYEESSLEITCNDGYVIF